MVALGTSQPSHLKEVQEEPHSEVTTPDGQGAPWVPCTLAPFGERYAHLSLQGC